MNRNKLAANLPLFYVYKFLNSFVLDRAIWMLFLVSRGFSLTEIALIESAYHLTSFVFEVPTGYIADRFGKRASLLIAELVGVVSSCMVLWGGHGPVLIAGFMLGALVGAFQSGATSALIYETLQSLGRAGAYKRYNSRLSAISLVTLGISGMAGGVLSDIDWAWVYLGKIVLSLLTFLVLLLVVEPVEPTSTGEMEGGTTYSFWKQMRQAVTFGRSNKAFASLCVYGAILYSMSWSIAFYSQVFFQQFGLNNKSIGVVNGLETWISAGIAAVAFLGDRWIGKRGTVAAAGIGFIGALLLFTNAGDAQSGIAAFFLMTLFISYLEPLLDAYLNELLPSAIRATMLSVFSMLISTGMMITFSVIGFLADRTDLSTALGAVLVVWVPLGLIAIGWAFVQAKRQT